MEESIQTLCGWIDRHLDQPLTLDLLASRCGYSPYHFSVLFHQRCGISVKSYVTHRRMQQAARHLMESDQRILDIAMEAGYSSQAAFSRAFWRWSGMMPGEYRRHGGAPETTLEYRQMHSRLRQSYPVRTLHVVSGECMREEFVRQGMHHDQSVVVAMNEAMCWGETDPRIFSDAFVAVRARQLRSTEEEYRRKVIASLKPLLQEEFAILVLWFGEDLFCQMNLLTLLGWLDQQHCTADLLLCTALERQKKSVAEWTGIDESGYAQAYRQLLCEHRMPQGTLPRAMEQAARLQLSYRKPDSPLMRFLREHQHDPQVIPQALSRFVQLGLGDLQIQWLLEEIRQETGLESLCMSDSGR